MGYDRKLCEKKEVKDTDIKMKKQMTSQKLLKEFPNIKVVFCNGQKAFKNLSKQLKNKEVGINFYGLPSTSPLHTVGFEKKLPEWEQILHYL